MYNVNFIQYTYEHTSLHVYNLQHAAGKTNYCKTMFANANCRITLHYCALCCMVLKVSFPL